MPPCFRARVLLACIGRARLREEVGTSRRPPAFATRSFRLLSSAYIQLQQHSIIRTIRMDVASPGSKASKPLLLEQGIAYGMP